MFLFSSCKGKPVVIPFNNIALIEEDYHGKGSRVYYINLPISGKHELNNILLDETMQVIMAKLTPHCSPVITINNFTVDKMGDLAHAVATGLEVRGG